jgi:DNA invertase Pin-like site-specific DNA recombinase
MADTRRPYAQTLCAGPMRKQNLFKEESKIANIAYVRVSTVEQNEARQVEALKPHQIDKWFCDKCSGKDTNRPQYKAMLDYIREGDTVFIEDFSRLSRSVSDLLSIIDTMQRKGVQLVSLKERLDTSTPQGRLMVTMIAAINEFERANILERQREGIECAKARGVYKGRKRISKPDNWAEVYARWKCREISAKEAMEELGLKRNTFYNFVKAERVTSNG